MDSRCCRKQRLTNWPASPVCGGTTLQAAGCCPFSTRTRTRFSACPFAPRRPIPPAWPIFSNIRSCAVRKNTLSKSLLWSCSKARCKPFSTPSPTRTRPATRWPAPICTIFTILWTCTWTRCFFPGSTNPSFSRKAGTWNRTKRPGSSFSRAWSITK